MLLRLAWRSIWRNLRRTLITASSISLGVAFAIFMVRLAEGVYSKMTDDVVKMHSGHLTIEHSDYRDAPSVDLFINEASSLRKNVDQIPGVSQTKLLIRGQGVARTGTGASGVAVMGVEPSSEVQNSPIARSMVEGDYLEDSDDAKVIVGKNMAKRLKLDIGKKLVITTNNAAGDLVEVLCRVKGTFQTGTEEADGHLVQVPISFAQKLYGLPEDSATQMGILLEDPDEQQAVLKRLGAAKMEGSATVRPWEEVMPEVASYIKVDRGSNYVFQILLLTIILFTIFNTILMSVLERSHEFAVLQAIGTPPADLQRQVVLESTLIALLGCIGGVILGGLGSYAGNVYGIDFRGFYEDGLSVSGFSIELILRPKISAYIFARFGCFVLVATILLSLIPIRRIPRIAISDAIREAK